MEHVIDSGDTSGNEIVAAHDEPVVNDDNVTSTPNQPIVPPSWILHVTELGGVLINLTG